MMENRSFDHMLGFSGITGSDAVTGKKTEINGLKGSESNAFSGKTYTVHKGAPDVMPHDPKHEFEDVTVQLAGPGAKYPPGGLYPAINNSGFVAAYTRSDDFKLTKDDPGEVMRCFDTRVQLPVLYALAENFVVCDNWYASMPGPTWPNRMFAHAASSGGLDHSPSNAEIGSWETAPGAGFGFKQGTIYDRLRKAKIKYRFYSGGHFPQVSGLKGVSITEIREFSEHFAKDLHDPKIDCKYFFIEPSYDVPTYKNGTSQHPVSHVSHGEAFIKATYEAVRNSPVWEKSLLILTWDEHGGFYDHAVPPLCVAPGDSKPGDKYNDHGFTFEHFGPRVPALVISPLIPPNLIDHRTYDHSSIPATVSRVFGTEALTLRDRSANALNKLFSMKTARMDAPKLLPSVPPESMTRVTTPPTVGDRAVDRPEAPVDDGNLPWVLHSAMRHDLQISAPEQRPAILARVQSIQTRGQAVQYLREVEGKVHPRRADAARSDA
jgi:phospholipase C